MRRKLRYSTASAQDLQTAIEWYERQSAQLVRDFCLRVKVCLRSVAKNPEHYPRVNLERPERFARIGRFPWLILFRVDRTALRILGVVHASSDPEGWKARFA